MATKKKNIERREIVRKIILNSGYTISRSVDDWHRVVSQAWPDGWKDAPAKSTVKCELQDMHHEGLMHWRFHVRGFFHQERFWLLKSVTK